jgi:hypothetical protein
MSEHITMKVRQSWQEDVRRMKFSLGPTQYATRPGTYSPLPHLRTLQAEQTPRLTRSDIMTLRPNYNLFQAFARQFINNMCSQFKPRMVCASPSMVPNLTNSIARTARTAMLPGQPTALTLVATMSKTPTATPTLAVSNRCNAHAQCTAVSAVQAPHPQP